MSMIKNRRVSEHMGSAFGAGRIKANHNAI